jgi:PAS domain S-box-containing protein
MPLALPIDEQIEWLLLKSMMIEVNDDYTHHYDGPDFSSIGQNILEIYGGDAQIGRVMIRNFIEGGYQLNMLETEERNHLGEVIWSRISASSIIEDDHLVHIWGSNQNLTDLKRTEIALRESNLRNKLILESLPMAFYRAHASGDLSAIWVSDQIDQISGFSPEIMTTPGFWSSRIHPDDKEKAINGVLRQSKKGSIMREYRWSRSDGEYVWIMDNSVILYDDTNQQTELIGTWTDITEIKLAEETLRDSEERYRTIFEHAAEGISIHGGEIFIDVNQAWEEMFGWKKKDVIGRTPFDFSPPIQPDGRDTKEKGLELLEKARTGEEQQFDWRHTRADGTEFDAEIFMTIISLSGEEVMISFIRDLTERNRAEAAAQEERHRLARELHDAVSQTIFSASMIAQTLDRSWDKNPALVRENLKELDVLTQGALAEMRTLLLELRPGTLELISMPDLLGQLANGFAGRTKTKIQLDISAEESLPAIVRRVFFRLAQESLNNIIKHARAKKVNIQYQSLSDQAQLIIEDDGLGFDPENVGPGHHGIEIMKERAEGIGAEFEIDSQLDKGTIVKISWQPRERFK